jgi:23S rRNA pseudouridine955/2504/2580 synthase
MSGVRVVTVSEDDDGQRLDRWLKKHAPNLPYALLQKLIRKGQVRVDGGRVQTDTRLAAGQEVRIPPSADAGKMIDEHYKPSQEDADYIKSLVIYDDGDIIAINKPHGLASQGGLRIGKHVDGLLQHLGSHPDKRPKLCHRLDRDTSGLLLIARTRDMAMRMGKAFESRNIRKYYWSMVMPAPEINNGIITAPLIKGDGPYKDMMIVDEENGKFSRSEYRVIERAGKKGAFVMFWPRTGRTHQLRVHAQAAGFPIIGDEKYGDIEASHDAIEALGLAPRLHLHASRIIMPHPSGKGVLDITAPLPDELCKSWAKMGFDPRFDGDPFQDVKL